ncbi:MAG TPA: biotin-dependent carboxyltransferase family protein [Herpetosiphonaceae bacterium]
MLQPGPLLTIQDGGRAGYRRWGVPASGALDPLALAIANRLLGNPPAAAALEITGVGCRLRFEAPAVIAVAGGDLGAWLDDLPLPLWHACFVRQGQELRWAERRRGGRCYLAARGGFAIEPCLGSASALPGGPFPGMLGRALRAGDRLPLRNEDIDPAIAGRSWPPAARPLPPPQPVIRVLPGPHQPLLPDQWRKLIGAEWRVSPDSNRMGYRLLGEASPPDPPVSIPSCGVAPGAIQLPPDGAPVVLLADAQTTGGYPLLAAVIGADRWLLGQLLPGDSLRFAETDLPTARAALREQLAALVKPMDESQEWGAPC